MAAVTAPSSFSQRRLWMLDRLYGQHAPYNVPCSYRVSGPLDIARLQRSLDVIVRRHEALRTFFRLEGNDVVQIVVPDLEVSIAVQNSAEESQDRIFHAAIEGAAVEAARPSTLSAGTIICSRSAFTMRSSTDGRKRCFSTSWRRSTRLMRTRAARGSPNHQFSTGISPSGSARWRQLRTSRPA
jgi:hypothetical protein